jgi:hypothetical protein
LFGAFLCYHKGKLTRGGIANDHYDNPCFDFFRQHCYDSPLKKSWSPKVASRSSVSLSWVRSSTSSTHPPSPSLPSPEITPVNKEDLLIHQCPFLFPRPNFLLHCFRHHFAMLLPLQAVQFFLFMEVIALSCLKLRYTLDGETNWV